MSICLTKKVIRPCSKKFAEALFILVAIATVLDALVKMPATSVKAIMNDCKKNLVMTLMRKTTLNLGLLMQASNLIQPSGWSY